MFWFEVWHLFSSVVDLFMVRRRTDAQKDIPILVLRQQVRVLQHNARQPKRFSRFEKTLLAVPVAKMRHSTRDFGAQLRPVLIVSPETVQTPKCEFCWCRNQQDARPSLAIVAVAGRFRPPARPDPSGSSPKPPCSGRRPDR